MIISQNIKRIFSIIIAAAFISVAAIPAHAVKVQIFKAVDAEKEEPSRVLRNKAVSEAFAQALLAEAVRMIPGTLSSERAEALKWILGKNYEEYISGYKDMDIKQEDAGVTVRIDVNVNRKALRTALKKMGMFSAGGAGVQAHVAVSNEKFVLGKEAQEKQNEQIATLIALYGIQQKNDAKGNGTVVSFSVRHSSKKRWNGELASDLGKWFASGTSLEKVWRNLWERYYGVQDAQALMNPKAVLVVTGWFNPEGVREFGRKLKSWDSAVQEVQLLDVEMKPTAVSASWSLEVSDEWVLKSYLNDYLPPRGLTFNIEGLARGGN
ncbi:hypothetical protein [Maridesulfovibrio hydrothermalis]|uniref:Putative lipoprotein n=1 Tax=Maridesulfovibrio hydrothermalis AM13 = DSM 14728 TaxID=1121451 RepID=L0RDJ0_9BACT|nr:hypothetical protein [Maridesulfovibrio hydrothermalis]CCO24814.1 putative lipoprotein [Maridesulfovibrio hydrothermalis AM13 = DSM 14728]